ncbi:MAG TPA: aminotransferase class I/II-fold pyridoxal phosphate-dependent enzyme, partial [Candidatus Polarisedimenticolia bacterium]|nr:aminotransferase class I/II-fold pyridoxal phosphate-dependent enzyme [Candidatus Polarisedimenticolia bacterium]
MKRHLGDLAIFGGEPAFAEPQHVGRPNLGDRARFLERVGRILDTRCLTNNGPFVHAFEERIAALVGVRHCVAVGNATLGLEIAARALGLAGEVIVPAQTFVATAHALHWQRITPVFCDIDRDTLTLDPAAVERALTPRTTGILAVHLWGRACDVEALAAIARRHRLRLLFDAAHAFGCGHRGRMIGGFGDAEVFSFHATKVVNCFEGGAITTDDGDLAASLRLLRNFGFAGLDDVVACGINAKMSEISAAMGLTSLESLDEFIAVNRRNERLYREALAGIDGLRILPGDDREPRNHQYVVLEVDEERAGIGRDQILRVLNAENVLARRYFHPGCHRAEPYRS